MGPNGRLRAVKVFSGWTAKEETALEIGIYRKLEKLGHGDRGWFPDLFQADRAAPWPWMSVSQRLAKHLKEKGALKAEALRGMALQLQLALQTLRSNAGLLRLDVKPANVLWCEQTAALQLCDFGMVESNPAHESRVQKSTVQKSMPVPGFKEYVTCVYRPPELWCVDPGSVQAMQAALTVAIEIWSYGRTIYEAASCKPLRNRLDRRQ